MLCCFLLRWLTQQEGNSFKGTFAESERIVRSSFLLRAVLGRRSPSARCWATSSPDRWRHSHARRTAQPRAADGASQPSDGDVERFRKMFEKQRQHRHDFSAWIFSTGWTLTYLLEGKRQLKKNGGGAYCAFIFTTQNGKSRMSH